MTRLAALAMELFIASAASALSWAVAPPAGVSLHWNPESSYPWHIEAPLYAIVVLVVVIAVGRITTAIVGEARGRAQRPSGAECATGIACVVFSGIQRFEGLSVLVAVAAALLAWLATYFAMARRS